MRILQITIQGFYYFMRLCDVLRSNHPRFTKNDVALITESRPWKIGRKIFSLKLPH